MSAWHTGAIYEIVTEGSPSPAGVSIAIAAPSKAAKKSAKGGLDFDEDPMSDLSVRVVRVAVGGCYDNLLGMSSRKNEIPCVRISFRVDRILPITKVRIAADSNAE